MGTCFSGKCAKVFFRDRTLAGMASVRRNVVLCVNRYDDVWPVVDRVVKVQQEILFGFELKSMKNGVTIIAFP